jgi:hypothetical protein
MVGREVIYRFSRNTIPVILSNLRVYLIKYTLRDVLLMYNMS